MFGKHKKITFCGCDHDKMEQVLYRLCEIEDSVGLSEDEDFAMHIAIQAISHLMNGMVHNGKMEWD